MGHDVVVTASGMTGRAHECTMKHLSSHLAIGSPMCGSIIIRQLSRLCQSSPSTQRTAEIRPER